MKQKQKVFLTILLGTLLALIIGYSGFIAGRKMAAQDKAEQLQVETNNSK
ncbi:MAG: hypothetical protein P1P88_12250 [Bacteroidales bacterium]|nr:hypothetical protein [Bacteroidales bacterium]